MVLEWIFHVRTQNRHRCPSLRRRRRDGITRFREIGNNGGVSLVESVPMLSQGNVGLSNKEEATV